MKLLIAFVLAIFSSVNTQAQDALTSAPPTGWEWAYEKECGSPVSENGGWSTIAGTVVAIEDGRTFSLVDNTNTTREVTIYAVDVSKNADKAKDLLQEYIYAKMVEVIVPDEKRDDRDVIGRVIVRRGTLIELNHFMLQNGIAEFTEMPFKTYYEPCLHRMLEQEARNAKLGIWADL